MDYICRYNYAQLLKIQDVYLLSSSKATINIQQTFLCVIIAMYLFNQFFQSTETLTITRTIIKMFTLNKIVIFVVFIVGAMQFAWLALEAEAVSTLTPTMSPTEAPTFTPTKKPTRGPTKAPTYAPLFCTYSDKKACKKDERCTWSKKRCDLMDCSIYATKKLCKTYKNCTWDGTTCIHKI